MKKLLLFFSWLLPSLGCFAQDITLPGTDGAIFQRISASQGAELELGINFNDANLTQVQVLVEKYTSLTDPNQVTIYHNWIDKSCDAYPVFGGTLRRVILPLAGGLYRVKVRRKDNPAVETSYKRMGVGEIFYVAGQSNTTGVGTVAPPASISNAPASIWIQFDNLKDFTPVQLNSSKVNSPAGCISNPNYAIQFPAGAADNDPAASYTSHWYRLAQRLVTAWNVPVAIYQAGWAGSSINQWSTGADGNKVCSIWQNSAASSVQTYPYYNVANLFTERKFNGVRAILWHQGEYDALPSVNTSSADYTSKLRNLIAKSRTHAKAAMGVTINLPWLISQASVSNGVSAKPAITSAQATVAADANNWPGPSTDDITSRVDGTHFTTTGLVTLSDRWYDKLVGSFINSSIPIPAFGRGSCTPPAAPTLSPISSTITSGQTLVLTASGCPTSSGTVTWSTGAIGTSITVAPQATNTYWATCTINGCTSLMSGQATVTVSNTPTTCVQLDLAANYYNPPAKRLTANGTVLKLQVADNTSAAQIWRMEDINGYKKFSRPNNSNQVIGVVNGGGSIGNRLELQAYSPGNNAQLWLQDNYGTTNNCANCYAFYRKGTNPPYAFGVVTGSWGSGTGNYNDGIQDFGLVSQGDAQTFGFNKWLITPVGCPVGGRVGVPELIQEENESSITISPNPNNGTFTARFYLTPEVPARLTITDLQGKVWMETPLVGAGDHVHPIQLAPQSSGLFILKVSTGTKVISKKLLINER
jgi:hypothetical protein